VELKTMTPPLLHLNTIQRSIDEACDVASRCKNGWELRRAEESDFMAWEDRKMSSESFCARLGASLLFGVVATMDDQQYLSTFYLAFSTWDGRVLYLDRLAASGPRPNTNGSKSALTNTNGAESNAGGTVPQEGQHHAGLNPLVRYLFGDIAIRLQCTRFTWQHYDYPQDLAGNVQPEYLKGWLTLHWDSDSMREFAGDPPLVDESSTMEDKMESCLNFQQNTNFRLRVASPEDVDTIGRLVQGLADFEKEPDAVNVSVAQYRVDGFEAQPLFYCFLIEDVSDKTAPPYACGMAFCFIGCNLGAGPFVYLEDLFIEENYRGKGGGSLVMRSLAMLGQTLGCEKLVWQALDWNTPALTFYSKIGAKVQDGLLTSRYAGQKLKDFVGH
jgi:GNAT superfamily N-acetyltransferase